MKKYSNPEVHYVQLFLEESIANDCMQMVTYASDSQYCQNGELYSAVDLGRPCCESNQVSA